MVAASRGSPKKKNTNKSFKSKKKAVAEISKNAQGTIQLTAVVERQKFDSWSSWVDANQSDPLGALQTLSHAQADYQNFLDDFFGPRVETIIASK